MKTRKPEKSEVYKVAKIVLITLISVSVISSIIYFSTNEEDKAENRENNIKQETITETKREEKEIKKEIEKKFYLLYSPTCPHCHNAMKFIDGDLKTKYKNIEYEYVNVQTREGFEKYKKLVKEHNIESNGVPVAIIGEKVILGFGEATKQEYINNIEELLK